MTAKGWTWGQVERWAADREHWRTLVMALRANQPEEDWLGRYKGQLPIKIIFSGYF